MGSLIPLNGLSFGLTVAGNAIFGMVIGGYLEIANAAIQGWIGDAFDESTSENAQCAVPGTQKDCNALVPSVIPIFS